MAKINVYLDTVLELNAPGAFVQPEDPTVYQFTLTRLDVLIASPADVLTFPFNPDGYDLEVAPRWEPRNEAGSWQPSHHWSGNEARKVRFENLVDAPKGDDSLELLRLGLEDFARRPTELTQRPTRVSVNAGVFTLIGVITALNWRTLITDHRGRCISAEFDFEITENEQTI